MQLVKELNIMYKGKVLYILFCDTETGTPLVYKADKAIALANTGNLGVYNTENEFGSVSVDIKKSIVPNIDKGIMRMAVNAEFFDAYVDAAWLNTGKPMLSAVCVLHDRSANTDYVWCKALVNAKFAQEAYNFFTVMTEIIAEKYADIPMITQMDKFVATADENYVYCGCIMIAFDALVWLMSVEGQKAFETKGSAMYSKFILNTAHLAEFDYKLTHRNSEKPAMDVITALEAQAQKSNISIAKEIQAMRTNK